MASSQGESPRPDDNGGDQSTQVGQPVNGQGPDDDGQNSPDGQNARGRGVVVARIFGIPIHVSPYSLILIIVYVILYGNDFQGFLSSRTEEYLLALVAAVLLGVSVLIHELSHTMVALAYKLPVRRIQLHALGGVSEIEKEPETPLREFCVSGAGPLMSLVLAAIGWGLTQVFDSGAAGLLAWAFMVMNLVVGVFNLVPGLPLDGGRMLRAVLWKITGKPSTATIGAAWTGRVLAVVVFGFALYSGNFLSGGMPISAIWGAVIGVFMWTGATQSIRATKFRERIPALQARRLARKAISVDAATPVSEAIRRADEARARAVVVVDHESKPIAILNESAVMATPAQRRPWIDAGSLARSIQPELVLPADISGMALLDAIKKAPASEYLLVEPTGQVYGVLAASDLEHVFAGV
ncbi:MAG TPA: site-2 protease family protein [Trebonia sp.]